MFRDVIYNGGGNTVPINLSYLDTSKPLQQFSVTIGQCVDKDQTTSPNLLVRTSSYGDSVIAGTPFTLSLGLYATDGNENLNDVIVSLTLPENILLNSGSLSNYVGTIAAKQTRDVTFEVMPSAGFTGTVANITVNMTGTGSITGKEVSGTTTISVPASPTGLRSASWSCPAIRSMSAIPAASPSPMSTRAKTPSATLKHA